MYFCPLGLVEAVIEGDEFVDNFEFVFVIYRDQGVGKSDDFFGRDVFIACEYFLPSVSIFEVCEVSGGESGCDGDGEFAEVFLLLAIEIEAILEIALDFA